MATEVTLVLRFEDGDDFPYPSWDDIEQELGCTLISADQEEV